MQIKLDTEKKEITIISAPNVEELVEFLSDYYGWTIVQEVQYYPYYPYTSPGLAIPDKPLQWDRITYDPDTSIVST